VLLETKISKDGGYQKQQGSRFIIQTPAVLPHPLTLLFVIDTLIVWTEPNQTDMALSFQEAEGCAVIW
jgi:protein phosphatase-4 regulatory subunit 3